MNIHQCLYEDINDMLLIKVADLKTHVITALLPGNLIYSIVTATHTRRPLSYCLTGSHTSGYCQATSHNYLVTN